MNHATRRPFLLAGALCLSTFSGTWATADGPDYYRVRGVTVAKALDFRAEPRTDAAGIGRIPADAQCLRNLGCQGGLSFEEFNTLSAEEKQRRLTANPRWCKVDYQGTIGWVEGRFLAEGKCAAAVDPPHRRAEKVRFAEGATSTVIKARLKGYQYVDYRLPAGAGQTLNVSLKASNLQNYFNVNPPGTDVSMFVGSTSGNNFQAISPTDGEYTIRVYLMRPAARRNESSNYALRIAVTGKPLTAVPATKDAVIPGTPFHASATIACKQDIDAKQQECDAFVIRRAFDGTATVEIRQTNGFNRRILFVKGNPVASDSQFELTFSRKGDLSIVNLGNDERYEIPDALVVGG